MLTFVTGNQKKLAEVQRYLDLPVMHITLDLPEVQSLDSREIIAAKARAAYAVVKGPVLVEDVSLTFHAFGRLPGPLIKWFLQEMTLEELCRLLDGKDRAATARVCFGYYDGNEVQFFVGETNGTISLHPRGEYFDWAKIFVPDGARETWGEMTEEERVKTAFRPKALQPLKEFLLRSV